MERGAVVHPNAGGKGVGRILLQKSLEAYKVRGVKRASLEAIKENTGAILLYVEFGYKPKNQRGGAKLLLLMVNHS